MPIKRVTHRDSMPKHSTKKQAPGWTASKISEADLTKAKAEGFLAVSVEIIVPSTEIIPQPQERYRVMFLAFLLRGFSLPSSWASLCLWHAAALAHAKFDFTCCLLRHSLRGLPWH
jgi:hypothetical protein